MFSLGEELEFISPLLRGRWKEGRKCNEGKKQGTDQRRIEIGYRAEAQQESTGGKRLTDSRDERDLVEIFTLGGGMEEEWQGKGMQGVRVQKGRV